MSLFFKIVFSLVAAASLLPVVTFAAGGDPYGFDASAPDSLKRGVAGGTTVPEVVGNIINIALSMIGIIFFLILVYAGFNWMIARGNAEQVDRSKNMIEGAVIGLIIVIAAYAITTFVFTSLDKGPTTTANVTST